MTEKEEVRLEIVTQLVELNKSQQLIFNTETLLENAEKVFEWVCKN